MLHPKDEHKIHLCYRRFFHFTQKKWLQFVFRLYFWRRQHSDNICGTLLFRHLEYVKRGKRKSSCLCVLLFSFHGLHFKSLSFPTQWLQKRANDCSRRVLLKETLLEACPSCHFCRQIPTLNGCISLHSISCPLSLFSAPFFQSESLRGAPCQKK